MKYKVLKCIKRLYIRIKYGMLKPYVIATAGDNVSAEIEYRNKNGRIIGFWAYGY